MINFTCSCGKAYHHIAEFVQSGGKLTTGYDWSMQATCICGNKISMPKLLDTNPEYNEPRKQIVHLVFLKYCYIIEEIERFEWSKLIGLAIQ